MISLLIVLSIFVAVDIGYKKKINVGLIAIAFSYIFGCFVLGMKPKEIIALWPTSLFFFIMMALSARRSSPSSPAFPPRPAYTRPL